MEKQFKLEYVGDVDIFRGLIKVVKDDGTIYVMDRNYSVTALNYRGIEDNHMKVGITFKQFMDIMSSGQYLQGDAEKAFSCWIEMFYVQQHLKHEPTCTLDNLLWEKTYKYDGAVTEEEKALSVAGWHVFTDGKEYAVIWSSECCCKEIVPMIGKEIVYMNAETAVIKL